MTVDDAPFELWMATPSPSAQVQRFVTLDSLAGGISARIIDVIDPLPDVGYKTLVVENQHVASGHVGAGKWFWIHGNWVKREVCQSGQWELAAKPAGSVTPIGAGDTVFTAPGLAYLSHYQQGWILVNVWRDAP